MPCLSGRFQYPGGILIPVVVLPVSTGAGGHVISGQVLHGFSALVDTGATQTCISTKVVQDVGLTPKGKRTMLSASHTVPVNTYLFSIGFPMGIAPDPRGTVSGNIQICMQLMVWNLMQVELHLMFYWEWTYYRAVH